MALAHVKTGRVGLELVYPLAEALMEPKHDQMLPTVDIRTEVSIVHIHIQRADSFFFFYIDSVHVAEASIIEDMLSQKPVLLLDDVMSELDEHRRHALVEFISGDMQTFITTANLAYFDDSLLKNASVVQLGEEAKRG